MELTGNRKYGRSDWRKIFATRRGTVIVAAVCAVVAAGILIFAMQRYRSSVDASGNPETVFVATQQIPKNTPGDVIASQSLFKPTQMVAKQVASGAIANAAALHGKVAAHDIYPGEQLTAADFTVGGGLPATLSPDMRAITISLDSAHSMAGVIRDGDHVDVYAGLQVGVGGSGQSAAVLRLLMSNVQVLKAAPAPSDAALGGNSNQNSNVTLEVNQNETGMLAYAADNGKVWLVLRPAAAASTTPPSSITVQSLLFGTKPVTNGGGK
jgi:pilus assembly protein CpaB